MADIVIYLLVFIGFILPDEELRQETHHANMCN